MSADVRDGIRYYGVTSINPRGFKEEFDKCIEEVPEPGRYGSFHMHQCSRKRGHGEDGLYCKQHAKHHALFNDIRPHDAGEGGEG